jgi:hypothetical protein
MGGAHHTETTDFGCCTLKCGACRSVCWPCFKPCSCGTDCVIDCCTICRSCCNIFQICDEPPEWTFTCSACGEKIDYYAFGQEDSNAKCAAIRTNHDQFCKAKQGRPQTTPPGRQQQLTTVVADVTQNPLWNQPGADCLCDGCYKQLFKLSRYDSLTKYDYSLCVDCFNSGKLTTFGPFVHKPV